MEKITFLGKINIIQALKTLTMIHISPFRI